MDAAREFRRKVKGFVIGVATSRVQLGQGLLNPYNFCRADRYTFSDTPVILL